ncbi:MAG: 3-dehydroquinate synthase [Anaerolineae bacterium CG_4_9_14_3_um_filter_57_17]|nr:MAG: 3-dehydroquinate synthase [Anaerolineae bacterium CG2_30_57_67]PJB65409.1 MAG: 3-dehydroquinate synthase [Anaerolineae bacterium CG_4_9_14_3_um_filter_57_17]
MSRYNFTMHIFLYGPPATGKSAIGKILAENLRLPFLDLDQIIEQNAGASIPQIMAEQSEAAFRAMESAALKNLPREKAAVIALGGGALLRDENRAAAEATGKVILLMADESTLLERLRHAAENRPLLAGDLREKLPALMAARRAHYDSFPRRLRVDGKTAAQNARAAQTLIGRHHLSAMGEYDVSVGQVSDLSHVNFIVTDENVAKFHLEKIKSALNVPAVILPAGEAHKNLETVSRLWQAFLQNGLDRKSVVLALGGGVVTDLTGFAAATYMRGINWVAAPTTLLAMVDAAIGGKTGFDLPAGKNLIGAFHPPQLVLADPAFLQSLPAAELISGMAEVVKHGVIADPELFALCARGLGWVKDNLDEVVRRAMAVKIQIIEDDPYEKGFRAALNLGHTVGHAVELVSGFALRHGEAVAIGLAVEAAYAARIGRTTASVADSIRETLSALTLPTQIPDGMPHNEIIRAMKMDKKKNAQTIRFALPAEIGKVELLDVTELEAVLSS